MPPEAIAFAAPRAEEMTKVAAAGAGAGIIGAVEGIIVKVAPQLGALEPVFTWGTLLGLPTMMAAGALFTRGLLGDLFMGGACGGLGVIGYTLPEMLAPITGRKAPGGGQGLSAEERALLAAAREKIKKLPPGGPAAAPARAQALVNVGVGYE